LQHGSSAASVDGRALPGGSLSSLELLTAALDRAFDDDEFTLAFQPVVSLATNRIVGFEALIRWVMPNGETVAPVDFIPIAEASGEIVRIGEWLFERAFRQLATWQHAHPETALAMAVNVSPRQFGPRLVTAVRSTLQATGVSAADVRLELTETTVMDDIEASLVILDQLRGLGVKISLDDFGIGHSSLAYLRRLPIDEVKIDRSFVHGLGVNTVDTAIVASVIGLAHAMGCDVTAEGVETVSQLERLRNLGCDSVQGYLLARPLSPTEVETHLAADEAGQRWPRRLATLTRVPSAADQIGASLVDSTLSQMLAAAQVRGTSGRELIVPADGMFSDRQLEIMERLVRGERVPTIARGLYLSQSTVRNHLSAIFRKLGVHSQEELLGTLRKRSIIA